MTVREAAARLEVKPATVYALCRAGLLGHQRIGLGKGMIRITPTDIEQYVASRRVEAQSGEGPAPAPVTRRATPRVKLRHF